MERGESAGRYAWAACVGGLLVVLVWGTAAALPLLAAPATVEGLVVYPDDKDAHVFYYVPGGLTLAETDGTPQFSFRRMRYVGTKLMGDQGTFRGRGDISFTVRFENIGDAVRTAHRTLKRTRNRRAVLLPIPVQEIQAELVYSVIEDGDVQRGERLATGLWAEPPDAPSDQGPSAGQWASKTFQIALNARTVQLMWQAYEENAVLLSLNYAVVAKGVSDINVLPREAQRRLDELRRQIEGDDGEGEEFVPTEIELEKIARTVRADALQIAVSPAKNPECFHSVDLDAEMPAGYVFLEVFCFDFGNDPDSAIIKKRVEIRGYGIAGGRPKVKIEFKRSEPDETSREVHFELAIDLDKGYEYRLVDFDEDGNMTRGDWIAVEHWTGILNVSREFEEPGDASGESTGDVDKDEE